MGKLTKIRDIPLAHCYGGRGMAFVPNSNVMYLNCSSSNNIDKLVYSSSQNTYLEEKSITIGNDGGGIYPRSTLLDGKNQKAYVSSGGTGNIYVFNYNPSNGDIGSLVTVIDTNFSMLLGASFDNYGDMVALDAGSGSVNYYAKSSNGVYNTLVRSCPLGKLGLVRLTFDNANHLYLNSSAENSVNVYHTYPDKCPQLTQTVVLDVAPGELVRIYE